MKRLGLVALVLALGCGGTSSNNVGPTGPTGGYADSGQRDGGLDSGHDANGQKPDANSRQDSGHDGNGTRDSGLDGGSRDSGQEDSGWDSSGDFDAQYADASDGNGQGTGDGNSYDANVWDASGRFDGNGDWDASESLDGGQSDGSQGTPDANGFDGGSLDGAITNNAPTVNFSIEELVTERNRDEVFVANGNDIDGDILDYRFEWGDNTSARDWDIENRAIHSYSDYSSYTATVIARDNRGGEARDTLSVIVRPENGLFVNAGPDMTLQRDVTYCLVFMKELCSDGNLFAKCGSRPNYAPGHSREGFSHSADIVWGRGYKDSSRHVGGWLGSCGTATYDFHLSGNYQAGDIAVLRFVGKDSQGNEAYDEALVTLE